tara:strand:+ start:6157 stop:7278 length:1122 start_codon:yes stop_codon:yes gene_type:complete
MKKIAIISGTRADYGLLKPLLNNIYKDKFFNPFLLVTGSHMEEKYGYTYKLIEKDNFHINEKININLINDSPKDILISMSQELKQFAIIFDKHKFDLIIILGDRYEMLIAAQVALIYNVPIAHLFGGDITLGAYDNSIRNSISQMSKYHFVSCESSRKNLIKMNINSDNIFVTGNPGLYNINSFIPKNKKQLYKKLNIIEKKYTLLIVYHPETLLDISKNIENTTILFESLLNIKNFTESNLIFIHSNADNFNNHIFEKINSLTQIYSNIYSYSSLDRDLYLNLLHYCNLFIGNSSSGIYEVPLFNKITLNIGNRQKGRERGNSVIDLNFNKLSIINKIDSILDNKFKITNITTPYKTENSSDFFCKVLKKII